MGRIVFSMLCFLTGIAFLTGDATGKIYYRWVDNGGVTHFSDEPPQNRPYDAVIMGDDAGGESGLSPGAIKDGEPAQSKEDPIEKRRAEVLKNLKEMIAHYSDVGGITAGRMVALKEIAEALKNAKMDGGPSDDEFYLKIEELVRAVKDHTAIIGRVNRLLREAKAIKGLAPPEKEQRSNSGIAPVS